MLPVMDPSDHETEHNHTDVSTVQSQRNDLTAEEFPEGPYGASIESESLGKARHGARGSMARARTAMKICSCIKG